MDYDVLIVGGSFAGLALAKALPSELRILILDMKKGIGVQVDSTGLIAEPTRQILSEIIDPAPYITHPITQLGVVAPGFERHFVSSTEQSWLHCTDAEALVAAMGAQLGPNVEILSPARFLSATENEGVVTVTFSRAGQKHTVSTRLLVGADGGQSSVARDNPKLSQTETFLAGIEHFVPGHSLLGPTPEQAVAHLWFGEFSLGYGGWFSPTRVNGQPALRIGFATHPSQSKNLAKIHELVELLERHGYIKTTGKTLHSFASMIPVQGPLKTIHHDRTLLIGDAAGFCGAFAADGIKGALASALIAAELIPRALEGELSALGELKDKLESRYHLMSYYKKQLRYRWIWNRLHSDRSFHALYDLVAKDAENFLPNYVRSKEEGKSLTKQLMRFNNAKELMRFGGSLVLDAIK